VKDFWAPTGVETEHNILIVGRFNLKKKKFGSLILLSVIDKWGTLKFHGSSGLLKGH
jgi:hypothetical protein